MAAAIKPASSGGASGFALRLLAFLLGVFFIFNGIDKAAWFADSSLLAERLAGWSQNGTAATRWYIDTVARPGVPLFARLVPLAELATGAALVVGWWTRPVALAALVMVSNFNFARGMFHTGEILTDGVGLPVMGALLALVIAGARLPGRVGR
ncbi:MAG: DoxX family membrane protein [Acidobacteria bacterium]|nr:DoxX family membrane protein [Acidobacteriota bacterium]